MDTVGSERYTSFSIKLFNMASLLNITHEQIINHRAAKKAAGNRGCISGRPIPAMDFFGYKDVQSWRPADPMNPHCFCFDCRDLWDKDATIDLQLISDGHTWALESYAELLPVEMRPPELGLHKSPLSLGLPTRSNGGGIAMVCDTTVPRYGSFDEVPMSLAAPRARDFANETAEERLKMDLATHKGELQSELITVMDRRRNAIFYDGAEREKFLASIDTDEQALWKKLDAITLLLK
jgi:hypothetical protein